ncbi:hypothetical protein OAE86_01195 [Akkermansiaceae bacterium]|nr:hypothetical protein [Akkermansiaceae bacterium]
MRYLVPLVLILSPVVFSGCKSGDTTGSSEAKAAEEAKLAEETKLAEEAKAAEEAKLAEEAKAAANRKETIAEVMTFLKSRKFFCYPEKTEDSNKVEKQSHWMQVLDYDEETEELLVSIEHVLTVEWRDDSSGFSNGYKFLQKWKIPEMNPVISFKGAGFSPKSSSKCTRVSLSGTIASKSVSAETKVYKVNAFIVGEDDKKLEAKEFAAVSSTSFVVSADDASRIKAALDDLLKVHGVKPSKY